ncbi:hypothetical protein FACS189481_1180 [Clostridia bacterium]|nr:hypothetical protein FACS189481_1180 [Clostridia bacterium]
MATWNPWHGCKKISPGCLNCYVYRLDERFGRNSSVVTKTKNFDLPIRCCNNGEYKLKTKDIIYTCLSSDFFLEDADIWCSQAWEMIKERADLKFFIITKRIDRFHINLPEDWGAGYENVTIACTIENQDRANFRLPIFLSLPIKHRVIVCEPLLEQIDFTHYLGGGIEEVSVGGESGNKARICDFDWVLGIRNQCQKAKVGFCFRQTGALFKKENKIYKIDRKHQQIQAQKANVDYSSQ